MAVWSEDLFDILKAGFSTFLYGAINCHRGDSL